MQSDWELLEHEHSEDKIEGDALYKSKLTGTTKNVIFVYNGNKKKMYCVVKTNLESGSGMFVP